MPELKYYIPVKLKTGFTNLSLDNFPEIKDEIPSLEDMNEHFRIVKHLMETDKKQKYEPITIMVPLSDWDKICKKIKQKTGMEFTDKAISVIIENQQAPIVQVIKK